MKKSDRIILIIGGARSGKSLFALGLGEKIPGRRVFVATAESLDAEMAERIGRHRSARSKKWETVEEPIHLCDFLSVNGNPYRTVLIDCLTVWLSNLMQKDEEEKTVLKEIDHLAETLKAAKQNVILVSNEVGWGIVPVNFIGRKFRDLSGLMNQKIAEAANAVYLVSAGIPLRIK